MIKKLWGEGEGAESISSSGDGGGKSKIVNPRWQHLRNHGMIPKIIPSSHDTDLKQSIF